MSFSDGKKGRWITTDTGRHVFIEDGQSVEDALKNAFDEEYQSESDGPEFDADPEPTIDYTEHKEKCLKSFKGIWDAPYKFIKQRFIDAFNNHEVIDEDLENILFGMLDKKVNIQKVWIKTEYTGGGTYYNAYQRKLIMNISDNPEHYMTTMNNLIHEMGHALDNDGTGKYYSSTYKSKKYDVTLADMLEQELRGQESDMSEIVNEYNNWEHYVDLLYEDWKAGNINREFYKNERARVQSAYLNLCDTIQGTYGYKYVKEKFDNYTHADGYFDWYSEKYPEEAKQRRARNRGTEFFAEMTDDLCNDKEHLFSKYMQTIAPKSCEIYYEILEEQYGYKRK